MKALTFVIDVGVGKSVETYLQDAGYQVIIIREIDPSMTDLAILKIAQENQAMVITMDKDFGELIHSKKEQHDGVLLLRMEDATGSQKKEVIAYILTHFESEIKGKFCVYQSEKLRIKD
jgi:predicted nuclease of predicted toxin-antitoxin system